MGSQGYIKLIARFWAKAANSNPRGQRESRGGVNHTKRIGQTIDKGRESYII